MCTRKEMRRQFAVRMLISILVDAILAGGCYGLQLNLATTSLLFLLAVVLQALGGGMASSLAASVIAALVLDYFFVAPVLTLRIASPFDGVALLVFITTSLIITYLASRAREEARTAERRRETLERLYELSQRLLWMGEAGDVIAKLLAAIRAGFGLRAVCLFDGPTAATYLEGESSLLVEKTRQAFLTQRDCDTQERSVATRCLRMGGRVGGAIGFEGLSDVRLTAGPLTALAAALLERSNAFQEASRAGATAKAEVFRAAVLDALAHEFKTPLAIIAAAAGGMREAGLLSQEQREMAETIEEEASRLGQLTTRLLRKAEVDRDQVRTRLKQVDCAARVATLAEKYANRTTGRRIHVERLPVPAEALVDEELLQLALTQLLENAVKYSRSGSPIRVSFRLSRESIGVRVWNGGSSISDADRARIFERFYRGADGQRVASGSGLGLYVARKIARAHGGTLQIDPQGTTEESTAFCLTIPLVKEEIPYDATAACQLISRG